MKLQYCFLLVLLLSPVWAQDLPVELSLEELPDQYTEAVFEGWDELRLNLSGTYYHYDNPYYLAHLKAVMPSFKLYANLTDAADHAWSNFQFSYKRGKKGSISLGNYRIKSGEGLVFSRARDADLLLPPPHPRSYSPFGAMLNVVVGDFNAYMAASDQNRNAKLLNDQIVTLPRSKSQSIEDTKEQILAGGLIWEAPPFSIGADIYHQAYDRGFASSNLDSLLTVYSLGMKLHSAVHRLGIQAAYASETPALSATWEMQTPSFAQSWRFTRIPRWQRPAYAAKPLKLSSLDQREEIEASLMIKPFKRITFKAGSIINRSTGDIDKASWNAQHSLQGEYRDRETSLSLKLLSIDREILSEIDAAFLSTIPTHYRVYINLTHQLRPQLSYHLSTRYQHQNKIIRLSEASYLRNSFRYKLGKLKLELGVAMWMSLNQKLYIETDTDSGYEALRNDNLRLESAIDFTLKNLQLIASLQQSLQSPHTTTARLGLGLGF